VKLSKGDVVRHYKGQVYEVLTTATHTETDEELVIYRNIKNNVFDRNGYQARPAEMFNDQIGKNQTRFTRVPGAEVFVLAREGRQRKWHSMLESIANTASGFVISYFVWLLLCAPLFNIPTSPTQAFWITCIFTVVSIARNYVIRRISTRLENKEK